MQNLFFEVAVVHFDDSDVFVCCDALCVYGAFGLCLRNSAYRKDCGCGKCDNVGVKTAFEKFHVDASISALKIENNAGKSLFDIDFSYNQKTRFAAWQFPVVVQKGRSWMLRSFDVINVKFGGALYFASVTVSSLSLGRTRFNATARMNTTATQFSAKIV